MPIRDWLSPSHVTTPVGRGFPYQTKKPERKNKMKTRFHGITSLVLVFAAIVLAAIAMFQVSLALGVVYLVICGTASLAMLYAYCAKCPSRQQCGHVFPGKIAGIFKNRQSGPYTKIDLAVTGLALALLIGMPQFWLYRYFGLFIAFWVMTAIAVIQIHTFVCRACNNTYCPSKSFS